MAIYIHGMGNISPQKSWGETELLSRPLDYSSPKLFSVEPDYAEFIDPKQIRRMSRIIKMGVASATIALRESGLAAPDGIITATGLGCLEDTGTFLGKMVENKEEALNPTPFIQSTHNTIGSQIALMLQCQGYNQTYTQRGLSFENALVDTAMQASEHPDRIFLLGAIDEITTASHSIENRFHKFRMEPTRSLSLFAGTSQGTVHGEGSAFFVVSGIRQNAKVCIRSTKAFYKPGASELATGLKHFLEESDKVDLILSGRSGDAQVDDLLTRTLQVCDPSIPVGYFKHLCGEYPVASAFACWLSAAILQKQFVPGVVCQGVKAPLQNIVIFNQFFGTHYSIIQVSLC